LVSAYCNIACVITTTSFTELFNQVFLAIDYVYIKLRQV